MGGYDAANLSDLSLIESEQGDRNESFVEIPFSEEPQAANNRLEREIIALKTEIVRLKQENEVVKKDLDIAKQVIRRAKEQRERADRRLRTRMRSGQLC